MRLFETAHRAIGSLRFRAAELAAAARDIAFPMAGNYSSPAAIDAAQLESRILFSAAPLAIDVQEMPVAGPADVEFADIGNDLPSLFDAADVGPEIPELFDDGVLTANFIPLSLADATSAEASLELIFVDGSVDDYETLVADLLQSELSDRDLQVIILDGARDGIEQISEVLRQYDDVDAVHIASHGTGGRVKLGSTWLSNDNIDEYANQIGTWNSSLKSGADLLFYGCDLASTDDGRDLAGHIGELCDCDVAASIDDTGHAKYDGDWDLEYATGAIDTQVAFSADTRQSWNGLLAVINVTQTADAVNAPDLTSVAALIGDDGGDGISLREAILAVNAGSGGDTISLGADTYTLSIMGTGEDAAATGDLDILKDVTITGVNATSTIIDASGFGGTPDRVFDLRAGTTTMSGLTITGGSEALGAGIDSQSSAMLILSDVEIRDNDSTNNGGGIFSRGTLNLDRVSIANNTATNKGGGIYFSTGSLGTLTNVTISGNSATGGGGFFNFGSFVTVTNSTIAANSTGVGTGGGHATQLRNTVLDNIGMNADGALLSLGNNIDSDGTASLGDALDGVDPQLGGLQLNGGFTRTHGITASSPAYNAGTTSSAPPTDQRGVARDDGSPDIGAFEVTTANAPPTDITPNSFAINENIDTTGGYSVGTLTATDPDGGETFTWSIQLGGDGALFAVGGGGLDELILDDGVLDFETKSSYSVNLRVTDSALNTYDETLTISVNDLADGTISGTVYEDIDGDGDILDDGVGAAGVTVDLYIDDGSVAGEIDAADSFVTSDITDGSGDYLFTGLSNDIYWVVVDSATIDPDVGFNGGFASGDAWAEQTYGVVGSVSFAGSYSYAAAAGAFYGGMQSEGSDNAAALTTAEHVTRVIVSGSDVTGVDSGFSFNAIVNTSDDGAVASPSIQGSLRQFILNSNAIDNTLRGLNSSQFAIPTTDSNHNGSGNGEFTITPAAVLPNITYSVVLDGTTQAGFAGRPIIEINGTSVAAGDQNGLTLQAGGSTVRGFVINRFLSDGIEIKLAGGNTIEGNFIGTDVTGTLDRGNAYGISVKSNGNIIGGTTAAQRNIISASFAASDGYGVGIYSGGTSNHVLGNYIGTDANGTAALGNNVYGVYVVSDGNFIGGATAAGRNVISGNAGHGVEVTGNNNQIRNNYVGTDASGSLDLGNAQLGIRINNATGNHIGAAGVGNVVSGNSFAGIAIVGSSSNNNFIQGNLIGTDATGMFAIANDDYGIDIWSGGPDNNTIGGLTSDLRNVISGNGWAGIHISGGSDNLVQGNYIGTDINGNFAPTLRNGTAGGGSNNGGIDIDGGATNNTIGGTAAGAGNLIAHNAGVGVRVDGAGTTGNKIHENEIYANTGIGIDLVNGNANRVAAIISSVTTDGVGSITIAGTYNDATLGADTLTIEYFSNPGNDQEGRTSLDRANFPTIAAGTGTINHVLMKTLAVGDYVTATVTDTDGNTSEFSVSQQAVSSNSAPTDIMPNSFAVNENIDTTGDYAVGMLSATDADTGETFTWSVQPGGDGALFSIGGAGSNELMIDDGVLDFETRSSYSVNVRVTDSASNTYDEALTVTVNDLNDTPTTSGISDVVVTEDDPPTVIDLFAAFADAEDLDSDLTYVITANTNVSLFDSTPINGVAGTLTLNYGANRNGTSDITVRATDTGGEFVETTFNVLINADNDPPSDITPNTFSMDELTDTTGGVSVGTLNTTDPDTGDTFSYAVQPGGDGALFTIGGVGSDELILDDGILDFETKSSYSINLRVTDSGLSTYDETITVMVNDLNETPTDIVPNSFAVSENTNTSGGFLLGTLTATDEDTPESFTYSILAGGDGALFTIGGAGSDELILDDGMLDYETQPSYSVNIRVTDSALNTYDQTLTVNVNDLNETPTDIAPNSFVVDENTDTSAGVSLGVLTTTDEDSPETFSYSILAGGDGALFAIGGVASDELIFDAGLLDFESKSSYSVNVRVTDSALNTYDETLTVNVNDLNETPTDIAPNSFAVNENTNTAGGFSLGALTTTDEDSPETFTYSILAGGDGVLFTIGGAGLDELNLDDGVLDFETRSSYSVNLRVTDSGLNTYDETITVNVNNVNEAPSDISPDGVSLPEGTDTTGGLSLTTLTTTDPDSGETFTYSIQPGADGALFSIGGVASDELVLDDGVLDEATKNTYTVNLRVTDTGSNTYDETFTVNVTSVNLPPTDIMPNLLGVNENVDTTGGSSVGILSASDPDGGETFTFSILPGGDGGLFSIGGAGSDELILDDGMLDFETDPSYSVNVRVTDSALNTFDETITVNVKDVNEPPVVSLINTTTTLAENTDTTASVKVADILVGNDALGTNTLVLAGSDAAEFVIVGGTELHLRAGASLDFESQPLLNVTVAVNDTTVGGTPDDTATLALAITDVNESPVAADDVYVSVSAAGVSTTSGVLVNDIDPEGDPVSVSVVAFPGHGVLSLSADGSFTYVPHAGFVGTDTFIYQIDDGVSVPSAATVRLIVQSPAVIAPPPTAVEASNDGEPLGSGERAEPSSDEPLDMETASGEIDTNLPPRDPSVANRRPHAGSSNAQEESDTMLAMAVDLGPTISVSTADTHQPTALRSGLSTRPALTSAWSRTVSASFPIPSIATVFIDVFDELRDEVDSDQLFSQAIIGTSLAATTSLSVGYVIWLIRGGVLLSSVLSSLPAWRMVDPLPVLGFLDDDEESDTEDESLESLVAKSNKADGVQQ